MKIDLFLNKLSHDHSYLIDDELAATGWIHGMPKAPLDRANPITKLMGGTDASDHLPHLAIRKEQWGAFLVHGPTASVYQLDPAATALFERLKAGETFDDIRKKPDPFTSAELDAFQKQISDLNLL